MADEYEAECVHGLTVGTCSTCKEKPIRQSRTRRGGMRRSLDSPAAIEQYRSRYRDGREQTFDAYVEVFFGSSEARAFPGGWTTFSRCANAEPALGRDEPSLVERAEALMRRAGYEADDSGRPRSGRRWLKVIE